MRFKNINMVLQPSNFTRYVPQFSEYVPGLEANLTVDTKLVDSEAVNLKV